MHTEAPATKNAYGTDKGMRAALLCVIYSNKALQSASMYDLVNSYRATFYFDSTPLHRDILSIYCTAVE